MSLVFKYCCNLWVYKDILSYIFLNYSTFTALPLRKEQSLVIKDGSLVVPCFQCYVIKIPVDNCFLAWLSALPADVNYEVVSPHSCAGEKTLTHAGPPTFFSFPKKKIIIKGTYLVIVKYDNIALK